MNLKKEIENRISKYKSGICVKGVHEFILKDSNGNINKITYANRIVETGRIAVSNILANITKSTDGINYCGFGTGDTAVTDSDTTLESESVRKSLGSSQLSDDDFIVSFYFTPDEANGTWTEYGTFIDGTATTDSGSLFSRTIIDLTKESGQGLTINSQYNVYDINDV